MRYVILGAGAVGGVLAATLARSGSDVTVVARGENLEAIERGGLRLITPAGESLVDVAAVSSLESASLESGDVLIVAVKGQDTLGPLRALARQAPRDLFVVCAQNGVENERVALRLFANVYGMCVMTPATHLEPGVVVVHAAPEPGVFDLGRWPGGVDDCAENIAADIRSGGAFANARADIATLKWGKLLSNVHNAHEALVGEVARDSVLARLTREEATAAMRAAGVDVDGAIAAARERFGLLQHGSVAEAPRSGGSSWQSLTRGSGDIEADFLNGEIVLLGRLYGVATPVNEMLQRRANEAAAAHRAPGSLSEDDLMAELA